MIKHLLTDIIIVGTAMFLIGTWLSSHHSHKIITGNHPEHKVREFLIYTCVGIALITVGSNIIKASDGGSTITMDTSDNVSITGDLTIAGDDIIIGGSDEIYYFLIISIVLFSRDNHIEPIKGNFVYF